MMRTVGTGADATAPTCHPLHVRGQRERVRSLPARAGLQVVRVLAAIVILFVVLRAAWYPVWAMTADRDDLAASWGGPNPFFATIGHWVIAGLIGGVCVGVWMVCTHLLRADD